MKKIAAAALCLSMVFSGFSVCLAADTQATAQATDGTQADAETTALTDVAGTKYETAVQTLVSAGVVSGFSDGTFKPNNTVTRAEMAKMIVTAQKIALDEEAEITFSDMEGHWAASYVQAAADAKILNGYTDGTFGPDNTVSYSETAKILIAAKGYTPGEVPGTWPDNYLDKAEELGILKLADRAASADFAVTRGNAAIMFYRSLYGGSAAATEMNVEVIEEVSEPVSLSLEDAIKKLTTSGYGYELAVLNKQNNEAMRKQQAETLNDLELAAMASRFGLIDGFYSTKSYSAKQLELYRDFLVEIAPVQYEAEINQLEYDAVKAYYDFLEMQNTVAVAQENADVMKDIYNKAKLQYSVGVAAKTDLTKAELNLKNAELTLSEAKTGLEVNKMSFNATFGYDLNQVVNLTDKLVAVAEPAMNLDSDVATALEEEYAVQALTFAEEMAQMKFKATSAQYPQKSSTYRLANIEYLEAQKSLENGKDTIEKTIRTLNLGIANGKTNIAKAQNNVDSAKELYRVAQVSYGAGMATVSDLEQAQLNVNSCENAVIAAIADYNLYIYQYKHLIGAGYMAGGGGSAQ